MRSTRIRRKYNKNISNKSKKRNYRVATRSQTQKQVDKQPSGTEKPKKKKRAYDKKLLREFDQEGNPVEMSFEEQRAIYKKNLSYPYPYMIPVRDKWNSSLHGKIRAAVYFPKTESWFFW